MAERTKKAFRVSVNGFRKKDVNGFILELSRKYTEAENEYREKIAALEAENEDLSAKLAEAEARVADAKSLASETVEKKTDQGDAKKTAEALSEIKRMRSQLKKRVREFENKFGNVLSPAEKSKKSEKEIKSAEKPKPGKNEEKSAWKSGDFESYLDEFRSSSSALFREFDKKYGTTISGNGKK